MLELSQQEKAGSNPDALIFGVVGISVHCRAVSWETLRLLLVHTSMYLCLGLVVME